MALRAAFDVSVRDGLRRRGDLVGSGLFLGLLLFVFANLWQVVAVDGRVGDYDVAQLLAYLLVAELVVLGPGPVHLRIAEDVRSGDVAVTLLRPVDLVAWELARCAGGSFVRVLALAGFGVPILVLLVGVPRLHPGGLALGLLVLVPVAVLVETCARVGIGLLAFWMEDSRPVFWIWQKASFLLGGLMLPLDLYPDWLRAVAEALPFAALVGGPARTVASFEAEGAAAAALGLATWGAVFLAALHVLSRRALARLQLNGG